MPLGKPSYPVGYSTKSRWTMHCWDVFILSTSAAGRACIDEKDSSHTQPTLRASKSCTNVTCYAIESPHAMIATLCKLAFRMQLSIASLDRLFLQRAMQNWCGRLYSSTQVARWPVGTDHLPVARSIKRHRLTLPQPKYSESHNPMSLSWKSTGD